MKIDYPPEICSLEFSATTRQQFLSETDHEIYDICVIGGGITGAGIAWDATLRGLKTILIDKADFAAGTSSKSSKLVHGGFRYLKQYEFGLVHEALAERYILLHLAPHLVTRMPAVFPIFSESKQGFWQVRAGMILYELLAGTKQIGRHRMLKKEKLSQVEPILDSSNLKGGALYYDAKCDDFRLVMSTIQSAVLFGCKAINYVAAVGFEKKNNRVSALQVSDELTGQQKVIRANTFINATGPWSDQVRKLGETNNCQIRPTLGIHILVPRNRLPLNQALMILSVVDDRPLFAIPWKNVILLGTTDTDFEGDPDILWAPNRDVQYLLESFNSYLSDVQLREEDIISSFAGLRPLVNEENLETTKVTREHHIFESPANVFNIIGGKLTTYRRMAVDIFDYIHKNNPNITIPSRIKTGHTPLYGGEIPGYLDFAKQKVNQVCRDFDLSENIAINLLDSYGCHVDDVLNMIAKDEDLGKPVMPGQPYIWAQLNYALQHEMTVGLDDFLIRRTHILSLDWDQGRKIAPIVAARMAPVLGWDNTEQQRQLDRYLLKVELTRRFRKKI